MPFEILSWATAQFKMKEEAVVMSPPLRGLWQLRRMKMMKWNHSTQGLQIHFLQLQVISQGERQCLLYFIPFRYLFQKEKVKEKVYYLFLYMKHPVMMPPFTDKIFETVFCENHWTKLRFPFTADWKKNFKCILTLWRSLMGGSQRPSRDNLKGNRQNNHAELKYLQGLQYYFSLYI